MGSQFSPCISLIAVSATYLRLFVNINKFLFRPWHYSYTVLSYRNHRVDCIETETCNPYERKRERDKGCVGSIYYET